MLNSTRVVTFPVEAAQEWESGRSVLRVREVEVGEEPCKKRGIIVVVKSIGVDTSDAKKF